MERKLRVYVAGAYSAPHIVGVMSNMRRGLILSAAALKAGFAVYSPWCDCLLHFQEEFSLEECYAYSMPWLEVSDAVLVVPVNAVQSRGTQSELSRAEYLGVPVFEDLESLIAWRRDREHKSAEED